MEHQLFKLFHNEREIEHYEKDLSSKQRDVEKIEKKKEKADEIVKEKKKEQVRLGRDLAKKEQDIREMVIFTLIHEMIDF